MDQTNILGKMARDLLFHFDIAEPSPNQIQKAHSFISEVILENKCMTKSCLAKKETLCLYWAAQGKSAEETGKILCLSKATIETYRNRIKKKLKCSNMTQAVYIGMQQIRLPPV